jgi:hypothetical protein
MIDIARTAQMTVATAVATDEINKRLNAWKVPEGRLREHLLHNAQGCISNAIALYFYGQKGMLEGFATRKPALESLSPEQVATMDPTDELQGRVLQSLVTMAAQPALASLKAQETQVGRLH